MALTIVTPPASLAELMLDSIIDHLSASIETGESPTPAVPDQAYMLSLTEAAVALLDGPSGKLGRCLLTQSWKRTLDHCFPAIIELVLPPLQTVDSIKCCDDAGELQTLSPSAYRVTGVGSWLTEIAPAYGTSWPSTRYQAATIEVTFTAGYGGTAEDVPAPILQAIRYLVAHWYENRAAVERTAFAAVPYGVESMLAPYRVFR
ncbi:MAG TPA: head-tail connector protein [Devosia sp.]|nr:head-tail connector protein [Devosia sp.]